MPSQPGLQLRPSDTYLAAVERCEAIVDPHPEYIAGKRDMKCDRPIEILGWNSNKCDPQKADFVSKDQHRNLKAEIGLVPGHWTVAPLSKFVSRITYGFTNPMPSCRSCPPQPRR